MAPNITPSTNPKRRINTIAVGFALLDVLSRSREPRSLTELSRQSGLSTSQAQLYLNSFVATGLVEQDEGSLRYRLGRYARQLGMTALNAIEPTEIAYQKLIDLTRKTGKNGHISIWGQAGPIVVRKVDQHRYTPLSIRIGHVLPVFNSATGRVFWAHLHRSITEKLVNAEQKQGANNLQMSDRELQALRAEIRDKGLAFTASLHNFGFGAMAGPVFDRAGAPVCVIALMGPEADFTNDSRAELERVLLDTTNEVSQHLGWDPTRALDKSRT